MLADLLSGGLSGIVSRTATAPIELYKIQRQNPYMPHSTLRDVLHKEGFLYLWKGNGTNCLRVFPQFGINYAVYRAVESNIPVEVFSSQGAQTSDIGGHFRVSSHDLYISSRDYPLAPDSPDSTGPLYRSRRRPTEDTPSRPLWRA